MTSRQGWESGCPASPYFMGTSETPELCVFCGSEAHTWVTDGDGDRWPICYECLHNDDSDACCAKCWGQAEPSRPATGVLHCPECGHTTDEAHYYVMPFDHVIRSRETYARKVAQRKAVEQMVRAAFDSEHITPQVAKQIRAEIIETAKEIRVGGWPLDSAFIKEMEDDLQD